MIIRPRIYIAGPFTAPTPYELVQNVRRAEAFILPLAEAGACPLCPHTHTRNFHGTLTAEVWYEITMSLAVACHAIHMTPDWMESGGATNERADFVNKGKPVFYARGPGQIDRTVAQWVERWLYRQSKQVEEQG